jgi:hypothetical protein
MLFGGEIPEKLVTAVALNEDHFKLEGEKLVVVRIGRTKARPSGCLLSSWQSREMWSMATHIHI